jgi:hypothetical protein
MFLRMICGLALVAPAAALAEDVRSSIDQRFADPNVSEIPQFRQHVVPMLGRLGCNGRACHGSFQGQGGFRLSLFGYDFKADHENLAGGEKPRIDVANPSDSLALKKALMLVDHDGGQRFEENSWSHRVFLNWIKAGAKGVDAETPDLVHLHVSPAETTARQPGDEFSVRAIAEWSDGVREDVTPLCRFSTNNDEIATVDAQGKVTVHDSGDTHIVVCYDDGVVPVEVLLPVSDKIGPNYPAVPAPTRIDELVVAKLQKLGIVPSELCTDEEFLRRASLDITGTLPTPKEVEAFVADTSSHKRAAKIDELLERPGYAAWWATRLCDITGNNGRQLNNLGPADQKRATRDWFEWIRARVETNLPYDALAEGVITAVSRQPDESYAAYCQRMSETCRPDSQESYASQAGLTYYWARKNFRKPDDRALGFAYAFLGVRIQCAQCHKHPFDQWTKDDFDRFTSFFGRVNYGVAPGTKPEAEAMLAKLGLEDMKLNNNKTNKELRELLGKGEVVPFQELFVVRPKPQPQPNKAQNKDGKNKPGKNKKKKPQLVKGRTAKYLGGEVVKLDEVDDPRTLLMEWLRDEDNPYFAKSFVNRVWAGYFHVGIVDPPDDLSLGNPPSNAPLLEFLAGEFRRHGYDMKWLHREIANSRTYQLSWRTNETNAHDHHNFSHAEPRRMPAEIALDAIQQATASDAANAKWPMERGDRAIADAGGDGKKGANYVLTVFGRSIRESNCDCDRSDDASLLQTVYLQNDQELLDAISRKGGWVHQIAGGPASLKGKPPKPTRKQAMQQAIKLERRIKKMTAESPRDETKLAQLRRRLVVVRKQAARLAKQEQGGRKAPEVAETSAPASNHDVSEIIRQAYLRTLSRSPESSELERAERYFQESGNKAGGARDLLWALLNTKEFLLNH